MRKIFAILLLFIFSVTHTEFGQLLKLPLLFEHYSKHHKQNPKLSFIDFLKEHYSQEHQDGDKTEDQKLPFLTAMSQASGIAIVPLANLPQQPVTCIGKQFCLLNEQYKLPRIVHSIFHPPRLS